MKYASVFGNLIVGEKQYYCYVNNHPVTNLPIYVGIGKGSRYKPSAHKSHGKNIFKNRRWDSILKKYSNKNFKTDLFPLGSRAEAFEWEIELISLLKSQGFDLYNLTSGGEGGDHSEETREKCKIAATRAHKTRTIEDNIVRSEKLRKSNLEYRSILTKEDIEFEKNKFKNIWNDFSEEKKKSIINNGINTKRSKSPEEKEFLFKNKSAKSKLVHNSYTAKQKSDQSKKRSETFAKRDQDLEKLRGKRISETKKLRNAQRTDAQKIAFAKSISDGMMKNMTSEQRSSVALKAWQTKKSKQQISK